MTIPLTTETVLNGRGAGTFTWHEYMLTREQKVAALKDITARWGGTSNT